eukprot:TRINITY_DN11442_c0_g1_i1.p1 TRINITY_DN11442_c0_g1~~TRINITY_DN11442_c0_g1_i1.p1  ORF type:complete len:124 (+),score=29.87 TRINITY_DN11442_c0_g1_i1:155-526(+)
MEMYKKPSFEESQVLLFGDPIHDDVDDYVNGINKAKPMKLKRKNMDDAPIVENFLVSQMILPPRNRATLGSRAEIKESKEVGKQNGERAHSPVHRLDSDDEEENKRRMTLNKEAIRPIGRKHF